MNRNLSPQQLPWCHYPKANDIESHGLCELPLFLTLVDWTEIRKYRSNKFKTEALTKLANKQILELASITARSFAQNEPMVRHVQLPSLMSEQLLNSFHHDPFGNDGFGEWTSENIFFWFIRLFSLTNPSDPIENIKINADSVDFSLAILDENKNLIGGAFNSVMKAEDAPFRDGDAFLDAIIQVYTPNFDLIFTQEHEAVEALKEKYQEFRMALENQKVGLHFLIARSPALPKEDTFELVSASAEKFRHHGCQYMLVAATNQWTGAACEALNGTRVHYSPYRSKKRVPLIKDATSTEPYSIDGYISAKDSGAMFYVIRLN